MAKKSGASWADVKRAFLALRQQGAVELVHELFNLSNENKSFLIGKLVPLDRETLLVAYRKRVEEPFYPSRGGIGKLQFADARSAVKEYQKATGDPQGTLDLMLTFVENGNDFTQEYGDIDEQFYNAVESMMERFVQLLLSAEGRHLFPVFEERIRDLAEASGGIGWGYSDSMSEMTARVLKEFAEREESRSEKSEQ
jgi:hypothetical protein